MKNIMTMAAAAVYYTATSVYAQHTIPTKELNPQEECEAKKAELARCWYMWDMEKKICVSKCAKLRTPFDARDRVPQETLGPKIEQKLILKPENGIARESLESSRGDNGMGQRTPTGKSGGGGANARESGMR